MILSKNRVGLLVTAKHFKNTIIFWHREAFIKVYDLLHSVTNIRLGGKCLSLANLAHWASNQLYKGFLESEIKMVLNLFKGLSEKMFKNQDTWWSHVAEFYFAQWTLKVLCFAICHCQPS